MLILEGTGKELSKTGIRREAMQGALITVSIVLGVPVLRSKSPSESANPVLVEHLQKNACNLRFQQNTQTHIVYEFLLAYGSFYLFCVILDFMDEKGQDRAYHRAEQANKEGVFKSRYRIQIAGTACLV